MSMSGVGAVVVEKGSVGVFGRVSRGGGWRTAQEKVVEGHHPPRPGVRWRGSEEGEVSRRCESRVVRTQTQEKQSVGWSCVGEGTPASTPKQTRLCLRA